VKEKRVSIQWQEPSFFRAKFGNEGHHQGVAAEAESYRYVGLDALLSENFILILDEIQDPHNLGALCRSAYLFGVGGVVIPETHAASISPGACHSSVGAVEHLKIARVSSIAKALEQLKAQNFWVYGAAADGEKDIQEEVYPSKVALVIGSEEKGLRRLVRETCDIRVRIPNVKGAVDSLNASVAGGVILYEIFRQRSQKSHQS
jgi:23S rRNA (guanosine2251-2'-O)-methyltransferase